MPKIRLGRAQLLGYSGTPSLEIHRLNSNDEANCGQPFKDAWRGKTMFWNTWWGNAKDVTCKRKGCLG